MSKDNIIDTVKINGVYVPIDESNKESTKSKKVIASKNTTQEKTTKITHIRRRKKKPIQHVKQDNLSDFIDGFKNGMCLLNKLTSLTKLIK